jgi:trypsin
MTIRALAGVIALVAIAPGPARAANAPHGRAHAAVINGTVAAGAGPLAFVATDTAICSGTVVASNVVLTAGHCAEDSATGNVNDPSTYVVKTGAVTWTDATAGQVTRVSRVLVHPAYNEATGAYDAALLQLSTPTPAPVMPLADGGDLALLQAGHLAVVYGWGVSVLGSSDPSTTLRYGGIVTQSPAYCTSHGQQLGFAFNPYGSFCAIDPNGTTGGCHGDSGGPLIALRPNNTIAEIGITSRGADDCALTQPGFFTRVDAVSSWVGAWIAALAPVPPAVPAPTAPATPAPAAPTTPPAPTPVAPVVVTPPAAAIPTGPSRRYDAYTSRRGYISVKVAPDGRHVRSVRVALRLTCRRGRRTDVDHTWIAPSATAWAIPEHAPLDLTLSVAADRRYFRETDALTLVAPSHGRLSGLLTVAKRARAAKIGRCSGALPSFTLTTR